MKEIVTFFTGRRYSAVNTCEMQVMSGKQAGTKSHKSLQSRPSLGRGLSVLDALFHERKAGKQTRCPKCKLTKRGDYCAATLNELITADSNCPFRTIKKSDECFVCEVYLQSVIDLMCVVRYCITNQTLIRIARLNC